jgi:hypothetical protein
VPAIYTILAEGLASSGFIVVATNHPPASLISKEFIKFVPGLRVCATFLEPVVWLSELRVDHGKARGPVARLLLA